MGHSFHCVFDFFSDGPLCGWCDGVLFRRGSPPFSPFSIKLRLPNLALCLSISSQECPTVHALPLTPHFRPKLCDTDLPPRAIFRPLPAIFLPSTTVVARAAIPWQPRTRRPPLQSAAYQKTPPHT